MIEILPGVLEKDWKGVSQKLDIYKGFAKGVHVDLIDGKYAPNVTFLSPEPFKAYCKDFVLELHMMVDDPIKYLRPFSDAGFQRFIGHVEMMRDQVEFVAEAELLGDVGLAIDAGTEIDAIKVPLDDLDSILVMTVKAGYSGQGFMEENLRKVRELVEMTSTPIEIDGGINEETIKAGCVSGGRRFVATSFLFGAMTPAEQYKILKEKVLYLGA